VAFSFSAERATSMTLAPSRKNNFAVASPMPPVAPVMTVTFSLSRLFGSSCWFMGFAARMVLNE